MIYVGLDIETTGFLDPAHRIIEVHAAHYDETFFKLDEFTQRIDPLRSIPADATRVHGITATDLIGCATWDKVAPGFRRFILGGQLIVAHNGDEFDVPFINQELRRIGLEPIALPTLDTMQKGRWATATGKLPTLEELAFACDVPYDTAKAHAADYDVDVMMECAARATSWGWYTLPTS